MRNNQVIVVKL